MTVKQLKEQLIGIPDDAVIVCPASDHSYRRATVELTTAMKELDGSLYEDYEAGSIRVPILLVS